MRSASHRTGAPHAPRAPATSRACPGVAVGALLFGVLASLLPDRARAVEIDVCAAISLTEPLREIATAYERERGDHVVLNLAASSTLARQIEAGAPADLFFSADEIQMDGIEKLGLLRPGTRRSLLSNRLVVVLRRDSRIQIASPADLARRQVRRIALAEPRSVPAGIYAREWLQGIGAWDTLADKVVPCENVRAALAVVESGNAEAGIVYRTDAALSKQVRVAYEVTAGDGPKISYAAAVLRDARAPQAAERLLEYLSSKAARSVFEKFGFSAAISQPRD